MSIYKSGRPYKYVPAKNSKRKPSQKPGEYRIDKNSYIGETNNLLRRFNEHKRSGKFTDTSVFEYKIADGRSNSKTRRIHEQQKIKRHKPQLNKSKGGEGRIAKRKI